MGDILILGAGTAGTMLANRLRHALDDDWLITVVDRDNAHQYQPGYLFVPFGTYTPQRVVRPRTDFLPKGVEFVQAAVERVDADASRVRLTDGRALHYDWLIVATGTTPRPDQTPGMVDGALWREKVFDFYTLSGAAALHSALQRFEGGRLVVHITEMPIKCPVAPLEFSFLAEAYFRRRHIRHKVDITYVTPLDGAFTKPVAARHLGTLLDERSIRLAPDFATERIDNDDPAVVSYDGRRVPFDLLVTVPINMGQQFIIDSGLGDDMGFVPVDKYTLRSPAHDNIFAVGDASNIPTSKAGAVAHFAVDTFMKNFSAALRGDPLPDRFDGHANCFVECGYGEALLLDFNYDTEPLTGHYPTPLGPLTLLGRSPLNHIGKLAFEPMYWELLVKGRPMPVPAKMSMFGKRRED